MITPEELRNHAPNVENAHTRNMLEAAAECIEYERRQVRIGHIANAACIFAFVVWCLVGMAQRCEAATPLKRAELVRLCPSGNLLVRHSGKLWLRRMDARPIHDTPVRPADAEKVCR